MRFRGVIPLSLCVLLAVSCASVAAAAAAGTLNARLVATIPTVDSIPKGHTDQIQSDHISLGESQSVADHHHHP